MVSHIGTALKSNTSLQTLQYEFLLLTFIFIYLFIYFCFFLLLLLFPHPSFLHKPKLRRLWLWGRTRIRRSHWAKPLPRDSQVYFFPPLIFSHHTLIFFPQSGPQQFWQRNMPDRLCTCQESNPSVSQVSFFLKFIFHSFLFFSIFFWIDVGVFLKPHKQPLWQRHSR